MKLTEPQFNLLTSSIASVIGRPANDILPHGDHKWVMQSPYGPVSIYAGQFSASIYWYFDRHTPPGDYAGAYFEDGQGVPTDQGTWHVTPPAGSSHFVEGCIGVVCNLLRERLKALRMIEDEASSAFEQGHGVANQEIVDAFEALLEACRDTADSLGAEVIKEGSAMTEARRIISVLKRRVG